MRKTGFVDIDGQKASLYIFSGAPKNRVFEKAVSLDLSSSHFEFNEIDEWFLSISPELLNFRLLKMPFSDKKKLNDVVPFELENLIIGKIQDIVFDSFLIGGSEGSFDILVVYIEKNKLAGILQRLLSAAIDPSVITSIDFSANLNGSASDIVNGLLSGNSLDEGARIKIAENELRKPSFNLRKGEFQYTKDSEALWKSLRTTLSIMIILALVINFSLAFKLVNSKKEATSIKSEISKSYSTLFPTEKKITDELYQLKSHLKSAREKRDVVSGVAPLEFLLFVSAKKIDGLVFSEISLTKEGVLIRGEAVSMDAVNKGKMEMSAIISGAAVSEVKPSPAGKFVFTISGKNKKI
jgi:type II secretory pathway component PulL